LCSWLRSFVKDPINGYISDFDILVTVDRKDLVDNTPLWYGIEEKADKFTRTSLNLIVHMREEVAEKLQKDHYLFTDIRTKGIYLYTSKPDRGLPESKHLTDAEKLSIAQEHYRQWFDSGASFLITFQQALERDTKLAAFQFRQSVERLYACILQMLSNYRHKTYNIERLRNMAIQDTTYNSFLVNVFCR